MAGYDYIVVGGGSAGCVAAARLSEDPSVRVLLLEAGTHNNILKVNVPLGLAFLLDKPNAQNWGFMGEPEPYLDNRTIYSPRGKGLGGSSAVNGMVYIRGNRADYDQWAQMGLRGWSYEDVLPLFRRSEDHEDGANEFHGANGPLHIINAPKTDPLCAAIIEAGQQAGYPYTDDFNGAQQEGFGWYDFNVKKGRRGSSSAMFLEPAKKRPNLTVKTNAQTTRIIVERGRAVGVEYVEGRGGERQVAHCDGEVILSAGTFQSPHLLQVSGIGNPERLAAAGIKATHDLPGVGANLQEHADLTIGNECPLPVTVHSRTGGLNGLKMIAEYALFRTGMAAAPFMSAGAFMKSRPELDRPDMQLVFVPVMSKDAAIIKGDAFGFHLCNLHPESRGFVDARSDDPLAPPKILYNFLATENDRLAMRNIVKVARDVINQPAMTPYRGAEIEPGADVQTDAEIDAWVRKTCFMAYHPVGTCRMGVEGDKQAVCDNELRVFGIEGLRVADASVMPTIVGGNTNAPSMMIGEKVADLIRNRHAAPVPA